MDRWIEGRGSHSLVVVGMVVQRGRVSRIVGHLAVVGGVVGFAERRVVVEGSLGLEEDLEVGSLAPAGVHHRVVVVVEVGTSVDSTAVVGLDIAADIAAVTLTTRGVPHSLVWL